MVSMHFADATGTVKRRTKSAKFWAAQLYIKKCHFTRVLAHPEAPSSILYAILREEVSLYEGSGAIIHEEVLLYEGSGAIIHEEVSLY